MSYLLWHGLAESAKRFPDRAAVSWRGVSLTYRELDAQSTSLAALLHEGGIGPGDRVGILMPKSQRSVIAMLGTIKSGAAYVPVDPTAPAPRAAFILEDCGVRALITSSRKLAEMVPHLSSLPQLRIVIQVDEGTVDAPLPPGARACRWDEATERKDARVPDTDAIESDPAYVLYTSGSTGSPKGVVLSHRHAMTFVEWGADAFAVSAQDVLSNHAPLHFDLSVFDIYVALLRGACVKIVPDEIAPFARELARWIDAEGISVWYSVPSALIRLLIHGEPERFRYESLRAALFAGEVFPVKYLRQIMELWQHAEFSNLYGPTETNVCTFYRVPRVLPPAATAIPIGTACANTDVFAIDDAGARVAPGGEGELYVRGPALFLGYWRRPEKTREMLVASPISAAYSELVYRTGDIVRLDEDHVYWFTGRRDHMVKSRGYRIELGEVEQALYKHDGVKEVVVVAINDDEIGSRLHAFVVPNGAELDAAEMQRYCSAHLPRYMVPESFVFEQELPKTSTGKFDRVSLARRFTEVGT